MEIWLKIRIQRAKITMGTIFGPFISILSQKNILGQNMKNWRIFFDTLCMIFMDILMMCDNVLCYSAYIA